MPATPSIESLVATLIAAREDGEVDPLERLCTEHPASAEELRHHVDLLARAGLLDEAASEANGAFDSIPERLEGFRLIQQVGAGGMGVVFRARDEALEREVALKVVRPDQLLFPGARERFQREVVTIAGLRHPGIVPLFSVGESDGLPFYVMEFIEGATLSELLERLQGKDPRELVGRDLWNALRPDAEDADAMPEIFDGAWDTVCLRIVREAAAALEFAHLGGVLHRDVKPSNLMIDHDGRVRVVDFGLASSRGDGRLTQTGALVGSLNYMAPELVEGGDGSRASDVYALGATLYELLTLKTPYGVTDFVRIRESILRGDLPGPRRVNPRISADAETIVLHAMDPDPSVRYRSAAAFTEDAGRALEHRPLLAQRASRALRARRWMRRHPAAVVGVLVALVTSLVASIALVVQEQRANADLALANTSLKSTNLALGESLEREQEARKRAEVDRGRALVAIQQMLEHVARDDLRTIPGMQPVRLDLFERADRLFALLVADEPTDPLGRIRRSQAQSSWGTVLSLRGRHDDAEAVLRDAVAGAEMALASDEAADPAFRHECQYLLAKAWFVLGEVFDDREQDVESLEALAKAEAGFALARAQDPTDCLTVESLRTTWHAKARVLQSLGRFEEAAETAGRLVELLDVCQSADGPNVSAEISLLVTAGSGFFGSRELERAEPPYRMAWALLEAALAARSDDLDLRTRRLDLAYNYGTVLGELGRHDEARAILGEGIELGRALANEFPTVDQYRYEVGIQLRSLGAACGAAGDTDAALEAFTESAEVLAHIVDSQPNQVGFLSAMADTLANRAEVERWRGDAESALEHVTEAVALHERVLEAAGDNHQYRWRMGRTKVIQGTLLASLGELDEGIAVAWEGLESCGDDPAAHVEVAGVFALADATEDAMHLLERASELGWRPEPTFADDEPWSALRDEEPLRSLLGVR
ncbi:MAG: serine/threonine-protein kinase [Planctomycetota bacterium]